jgi:hypothetical protein
MWLSAGGAKEAGMPKVSDATVFAYSMAKIHALYVAKAARKGRSAAEVDEIIRWQTGYSQAGLAAQIAAGASLADFFAEAPAMNPARALITGVVCGVRVEAIEDPLMREIRYMDKLVDELAKGKAMGRILRG